MHNLDSQAADYVSGKTFDKYGFVLDIHDAYIVSPIAAADVRKWYGEFMESIHENRQEILEDYFKSIGITGTAMKEWDALQHKIEPVEGEFKCRPIVLK